MNGRILLRCLLRFNFGGQRKLRRTREGEKVGLQDRKLRSAATKSRSAGTAKPQDK